MISYQYIPGTNALRFIAFFLFLSIGQLLPAQTIKIMPLGDSITEARSEHASYRYWLWHQLENEMYDIDFVGSMSRAAPCCQDYDWNHEGHWGWRADEILRSIRRWASMYRPDIVLMHLGTNDIHQGQSVASTRTELEQIIDQMKDHVPDVVIFMAQIIPGNIRNKNRIRELNKVISILGREINSTQSPVFVVNQWAGFDYRVDTYDGLHPNETGEKKMAHKWYKALQEYFKKFPRSELK
jgi:hypothetical protein